MSARIVFGALFVAALGCARALPEPPAGTSQYWTLAAAEAEFGAEVGVAATRIHPRGWTAEPWPEALGPGVRARLIGTERRESEASVRETRRYALRLFALEPELRLSLPAWTAHARDGSAQASAPEAAAIVRVIPLLDPADAGAYELPRDLLARPRPLWLLLLLSALLVIAWRFQVRRRARTEPAPEASPSPAAGTAMSTALQALRAELRAGALGDRDFHERLAEWIRSVATQRGVAAARFLSSEELVEAWRRRAESAEESHLLACLLADCDAVKFARARTEPGARLHSLDQAARWSGEAA